MYTPYLLLLLLLVLCLGQGVVRPRIFSLCGRPAICIIITAPWGKRNPSFLFHKERLMQDLVFDAYTHYLLRTVRVCPYVLLQKSNLSTTACLSLFPFVPWV